MFIKIIIKINITSLYCIVIKHYKIMALSYDLPNFMIIYVNVKRKSFNRHDFLNVLWLFFIINNEDDKILWMLLLRFLSFFITFKKFKIFKLFLYKKWSVVAYVNGFVPREKNLRDLTMFMNKLSKWMRTLAEIIINHKKIIVILLEDRLLVILINNSPINHYLLNQICQVHK